MHGLDYENTLQGQGEQDLKEDFLSNIRGSENGKTQEKECCEFTRGCATGFAYVAKKKVMSSYYLAHPLLASEECPYQVEYLDAEQTPKAPAALAKVGLKHGKGDQPTYMQLPKAELDDIESLEASSSLTFRVLPIDAWARMKQYRNFIGL